MKLPIQHLLKRKGNAVLASLLIALVLLLDAMAACPALHELIHHDADEHGHQCAVTLFAHGQVDSVTVEVAPVVTVPFIETTPRIVVTAFCSSVELLPAGRAPPVVVSSLV